MGLLPDILSDLIAGSVVTAIVTALTIFVHRIEPERFQRQADRLRRFGWPILAFVFLATALIFATVRGATGPSVITLVVLTVAPLVLILVAKFVPIRVPLPEVAVVGHEWQILAALFFISTITLLAVDTQDSIPDKQIVFVVSMADEELIELRDVLDELEPEIGARIFLMNISSRSYVARLSAMKSTGTMKWDLIAADNNMMGVLAAKGLVEDLTKFTDRDTLMSDHLLHRLRPLLDFGGVTYFAPFRPNVKIALYNETKFDQYGFIASEILARITRGRS